MAVAPSPKSHCQDVGLPVEASVKITGWPVAGVPGLNVKDATGSAAGVTVTVRVAVLEIDPLLATRVTK